MLQKGDINKMNHFVAEGEEGKCHTSWSSRAWLLYKATLVQASGAVAGQHISSQLVPNPWYTTVFQISWMINIIHQHHASTETSSSK